MNRALVDKIVEAVLYEGHILYPYRPSSKKNHRERFTFGRVYPQAHSLAQQGAEPCVMQTECLLESREPEPTLNIAVKFLHPMAREVGAQEHSQPEWQGAEPQFAIVPQLRVGEQLFQTWHEAVERCLESTIRLQSGQSSKRTVPFELQELCRQEPIVCDRQTVGIVRRRQAEIRGTIEIIAQPIQPSLLKISVRIVNQSAIRPEELDAAEPLLLRTFASTHTVLQVRGGEFVSLMDPGPVHKAAAESCRNIGTWPVLVGDHDRNERDTMLSSPIILYDYPQLAVESPGQLFDGTEIDEILTLRILTMTDEEKLEMRNVDEHARRLLERTESLSEEALLRMHGAMRAAPNTARAVEGSESWTSTTENTCTAAPTKVQIEFDDFFGAATPLQGVSVGGVYLRAGARVRICPKARADLLDLALSGQTAIVESVQQDAERRIHLAVVMENDPGSDLGLLRQPGHRFFYGVDEIEPLTKDTA